MKNNLNKGHDGSDSHSNKGGDSQDPKNGSNKRIYVYALICLVVLSTNHFTSPDHWQAGAVLTVASLTLYVLQVIDW